MVTSWGRRVSGAPAPSQRPHLMQASGTPARLPPVSQKSQLLPWQIRKSQGPPVLSIGRLDMSPPPPALSPLGFRGSLMWPVSPPPANSTGLYFGIVSGGTGPAPSLIAV